MSHVGYAWHERPDCEDGLREQHIGSVGVRMANIKRNMGVSGVAMTMLLCLDVPVAFVDD